MKLAGRVPASSKCVGATRVACLGLLALALYLLPTLLGAGSGTAFAQTKTCGLPGLPACPGPAPLKSDWWYDIYWYGQRGIFDRLDDALAFPASLSVRGPGTWCTINFTGVSWWTPQTMYGIEYYVPGTGYFTATMWDPVCDQPYSASVSIYKQRAIYCPNGGNPIYAWQTPGVGAYCPETGSLEPLKAMGSCCTGKDFVANPSDVSNGNKFQREIDYAGAGASPLNFA